MTKKNKQQEIEQAQKSIKTTTKSADLDNEVLVNQDDLNILTNAKYSTQTIKHKQVSSKKSKILMGVFAGIGILGLAGAATGITIGVKKSKSSEEFKAHDIVINEPTKDNWTLTVSTVSAKKGEKVIFDISATEANGKYPSEIIINGLSKAPLKISEKQYQLELVIPFSEKMDVSFNLSDIFDPEILKPHEIEVNPEEPEGLKEIELSTTSAKINENVDVNITVSPEYKARMLIVNEEYAYPFEEVPANDFEDLKYKATFKMPAKKVNLRVELQERLVVFPNILNVVTEEPTTLVPHLADGVNIEYSTDKCETWTSLESDKEVNFEKYKAIYFRGKNKDGLTKKDSLADATKLTFNNGKVYIYGNIMGLLDNGGFETERIYDIPCNYCFAHLFQDSTAIVEVDKNFLPSQTLTLECYASLFSGCTQLQYGPDLPATNLTTRCYTAMFSNCNNLLTAPNLKATVLKDGCYKAMFSNCQKLVVAPELPAEKMTDLCYQAMFEGCISLTTTPTLPATTLALRCYDGMFEGCVNINCPEGYVLPATTLKDNCYMEMFKDCVNLTIPPIIKATTLAEYSCAYMFEDCEKLYVKKYFTNTNSTLFFTCPASVPEGAVKNMFAGVQGYDTDPVAGESFYF